MMDEPRDQISCKDVVRSLWEYLDGELDEARREQIRDHLSACQHCHGQASFESAFLRVVERVIDEPMDTAPLRQRVVAKLRAEGFQEH
jgi:anti-sigma factor (TIGR02949 family)